MQSIEGKDCSKCSRRSWFQIGYKNGFDDGYDEGMKAGLKQGNEILKKLLKEHQSKMDKLLVHEGER